MEQFCNTHQVCVTAAVVLTGVGIGSRDQRADLV
jgi:hypothetical protein